MDDAVVPEHGESPERSPEEERDCIAWLTTWARGALCGGGVTWVHPQSRKPIPFWPPKDSDMDWYSAAQDVAHEAYVRAREKERRSAVPIQSWRSFLKVEAVCVIKELIQRELAGQEAARRAPTLGHVGNTWTDSEDSIPSDVEQVADERDWHLQESRAELARLTKSLDLFCKEKAQKVGQERAYAFFTMVVERWDHCLLTERFLSWSTLSSRGVLDDTTACNWYHEFEAYAGIHRRER